MKSAADLKSLVLNADFRPLTTWPLSLISGQDALRAVMRDRAVVVEEWEQAFRSPSVEIKVPKVIALRQYAPVHAAPKFCRRSILLRDRYKCQYCGNRFPPEELTYDHVIPRSRGGRTEWTNILTCCVSCNSIKANQLPNYNGKKREPLRPLKPPRQPTSAELQRAGLEFIDEQLREDWGSWLYWNTELEQ